MRVAEGHGRDNTHGSRKVEEVQPLQDCNNPGPTVMNRRAVHVLLYSKSCMNIGPLPLQALVFGSNSGLLDGVFLP